MASSAIQGWLLYCLILWSVSDCSVHGWIIPFAIIWKVIKLCLIKQQLVCKHMLTGTLERSYWFSTLQNPCLTWRLFYALQLFNIATVSNTVTSYRVGPERPTPEWDQRGPHRLDHAPNRLDPAPNRLDPALPVQCGVLVREVLVNKVRHEPIIRPNLLRP